MIKSLARGFDGLIRKYTPDPLIYAFFLTVIVLVLGANIKENTFADVIRFWGSGFWALSDFTLQMVMILFLGYVLALSHPIKRGLKSLASIPKNLNQAAVMATFISLIGCFLNWGFGLIIAALFCKELARKFSGRGFAVLVAVSYSGFLVWHGGLSGSIPLIVSTPGNFNEEQIGGLVPLASTIFAPLNLSIVLLHMILLPCLAYYLMRNNAHQAPLSSILEESEEQPEIKTPADRLENSMWPSLILVIPGFFFIATELLFGRFSMNINKINFSLFMLALLFHKTPRHFINACQQASSKIWPLLIQYPLYAGIMAIMDKSGLVSVLSQIFVDMSTPKSLPLLVFFSAGIINIFIPSGGGQWAVQGPMVISAAKALGADLNASMMAVAWGDSWTNMIQPFWALPMLAIAGLKARDIMGSLVLVLLLSGAIIAGCFWIYQ
jgi:short-chain fatty acids transporter